MGAYGASFMIEVDKLSINGLVGVSSLPHN